MKEYKKKYRDANREKKNEYEKKYRDANRERIREYHKEYKRKYYDANKERLRQKITCKCGATIRKDHLSQHKRTMKHRQRIAKQKLNKFYKNYIKN